MVSNYALVTALVAILVGLVSTFYGYRAFRFVLAVLGGIVGFQIGMTLAAALEPTLQLVIAILAAVVLALIAFGLYRLGLIVAGALLGLSVASSVIAVLAINNQVAAMVIYLVLAVVGALLAAALGDLLIVISTAFTGASTLLYGVGLLVPGLSFIANEQSNPVAFVLWLVLGIVGTLFQYNLFRPEMRRTRVFA